MIYKSLTKFDLKGRGTVFIVKNDKDRDRINNGLIGKDVIIDGISYKVKGVESFALMNIPKGNNIGLLV